MTEFVGRTGSHRVYSYPETRRSSNPLTAFARNYATGSKTGIVIGAGGSNVTWNAVDAGVPPTTADIPITPIATGIVLVSGVVTIENTTGAPILATVTVHLDDVAVPVPFAATTIPAGATVAIPFLAETEAISPLSETHRIQVFVDAEGATILVDGAVANVQEVAVATG
jgi:hypothetical protein